MAYNPTTWKRGDIVTSEKLNNIESGIVEANVVPVITFTMDVEANEIACDKTYAELKAMTGMLPSGPIETACVVNARWVNLPSSSDIPPEYSEQHTGVLFRDPEYEVVYIYCTWMHHTFTDAKEFVKDLDFVYPPEDSGDGIQLTQRVSKVSISTSEETPFPFSNG